MTRGFARRVVVATLSLAPLTSARDASSFVHVVSQGETLAQISLRVYGTARFETALASANALDAHGGSAIVPGQALEVPAPSYARATTGDTWPSLAKAHLGQATRAETLARANGAVSWVPPTEGQELVIPAVIVHIAGEGETSPSLGQRYYNDMNRGWELDIYNGRKGGEIRLSRGEIVLVPILDLALTEEGKREARLAAERTRSEGGGHAHEAQRRAEADIPPVLGDVRAGRYVDAVTKGSRLLGSGELTKPQLVALHRALLEAYVALDAPGLAAGECTTLRAVSAGEEPRLDPRTTSPKIRAACGVR